MVAVPQIAGSGLGRNSMASKDTRQLAEAVLTLETPSISVVRDRRRPGRSDVGSVLVPLLRSPATTEVRSLHGENLSEDSLSPDRRKFYPFQGIAFCAVLSMSLWAVIILAVRAVLG